MLFSYKRAARQTAHTVLTFNIQQGKFGNPPLQEKKEKKHVKILSPPLKKGKFPACTPLLSGSALEGAPHGPARRYRHLSYNPVLKAAPCGHNQRQGCAGSAPPDSHTAAVRAARPARSAGHHREGICWAHSGGRCEVGPKNPKATKTFQWLKNRIPAGLEMWVILRLVWKKKRIKVKSPI